MKLLYFVLVWLFSVVAIVTSSMVIIVWKYGDFVLYVYLFTVPYLFLILIRYMKNRLSTENDLKSKMNYCGWISVHGAIIGITIFYIIEFWPFSMEEFGPHNWPMTIFMHIEETLVLFIIILIITCSFSFIGGLFLGYNLILDMGAGILSKIPAMIKGSLIGSLFPIAFSFFMFFLTAGRMDSDLFILRLSISTAFGFLIGGYIGIKSNKYINA